MVSETILTNARVVLADRVAPGTVALRGGTIADVSDGPSRAAGAVDCDGDFVIPGLVELHTDNLERHLRPRPGVDWPRLAAMAAHDAEFASAGATTVLDALRVGSIGDETEDDLGDYAAEAAEAAEILRAQGLLKADHHIHIRAEVTSPVLLEQFARVADAARIRLVSLMDHTPGQRQFRNVDAYFAWQHDRHRLTEEQIRATLEAGRRRQARHAAANRRAMAALARERGMTVASHDDAEPEHVAESVADGARIAEFPTTLTAARDSRAAGLRVLMGAPNVLRGGSHSGNVSALDLAREGLLDVLSSDYAPASLLPAAFRLAEEVEGYDLPRAIACVTRAPALAVGLEDRGAIAPGLRGDVARVRRVDGMVAIRGVWRQGERVA